MSEAVLGMLISGAVILPLALVLLVVVIVEMRRGSRDEEDE